LDSIYHIDLGLTDYNTVWQLQKRINSYKMSHKCADLLITNEHNHVYTLGKAGDRNHLLVNNTFLNEQGISYYEIDRGGDLTYHGPGQLVCYPVFDLNNYYLDAHRYLRDLEEVIVRTLKHYGIVSNKDEEFTGVWIGDEKICAIGIKISRWITMHGLAFNINNDLTYFDRIIPCGIFHKGVTSLKNVLGREIDFSQLKNVVLEKFGEVFGVRIENITIEKLDAYYKVPAAQQK
jgi:lipoyl(octanoyl) transferase